MLLSGPLPSAAANVRSSANENPKPPISNCVLSDATNAIRATIKGARESGLWQHRTDPSVFMALTRWDKFEDWWAFRQGEPPHHDAFRIVAAVSDLDAVEMCYEGRDVGIPQQVTGRPDARPAGGHAHARPNCDRAAGDVVAGRHLHAPNAVMV